MHHALYVKCREQAEREASPTACIIDSQSVKSAEKGGSGIDPHGFDAGKLIKGKKRHVLVDTLGSGAARAGDCRRRSGSRRRYAAVVHLVRAVPVPAEAVCRQRLCRTDLPGRRRQRHAEPGDRNRQTFRSRQRLRRRNPSAGSSSAPSAGSAAAAASPRTGRTATTTRSPSSASPPSASCSESSVILHEVPDELLEAKDRSNKKEALP